MGAGQDALLAELRRSRDLGFLGPGPVERHVEQADAFVAAVPVPPTRVLDLGAGGGVPGLVLALAWPGARLTLLEAQAKRSAFLLDATAALGLADRVAVVTGRAEIVGRAPEHRSAYDVVTARSFGAPAATAECGAAFLQVTGMLLVAEPPEQVADRWSADGLAAVGLVDEGLVRTATAGVRRLRLGAPLADRYPRRDGIPAKRPLF